MKGGQQATQTTTVGNETAAYIRALRQRALGGTANAANATDVGFRALSGDADAARSLMNPYQSNLDPIWDKIRKQSLGAVGDAAQMAGAFGGSRQGVAEGVALGEVGQAQGAQQYEEFQRAMAQALAQANLGMGFTNPGLTPISTRTTVKGPTKNLWDYLQQGAGAGLTVASLI